MATPDEHDSVTGAAGVPPPGLNPGDLLTDPLSGLTPGTPEYRAARMEAFLEEQRDGEPHTKLYGHQVTMLEKTRDFILDEERDRAWIKSPTGTGKTATFASVTAASGMKTIVLVPRRNLVDQTKKAYNKFFPDLSVSRFYGDKKENLDSDVVVCTYQSLANLIRQARKEGVTFQLAICDEGHRALTVARQHNIGQIPGVEKTIAFTATPDFNRHKRVSNYFGKFLYRMELRDAINSKALAPVRVIEVGTDINLSDMKPTKNGDFDVTKLDERLNILRRNSAVIDLMQKAICRDKSAAAFCISIAQAKKLADMANEAGIKAAAIHSDMSQDEKDKVLEQHEKGQIQLICSVDMLTEGWDSPRTEVAFMLRPTKSLVVAEQRIGRVLRRYSSQDDAISFFADPDNEEKQAIAVCKDREEAEELKKLAEKQGEGDGNEEAIKVAVIYEGMDAGERKEIIGKYRAGEIQLLCSDKYDDEPGGDAVLVLDSKQLEEISSQVDLERMESVAGKRFAFIFDFVDGEKPAGILARKLLKGAVALPEGAEDEFREEMERCGGDGSLDLDIDGIEVRVNIERMEEIASAQDAELRQEGFELKEEVVAILRAGGVTAASVPDTPISKFLGTKLEVEAVEGEHREFSGSLRNLFQRYFREVVGVEPSLVGKTLHHDAVRELFDEHVYAAFIGQRAKTTTTTQLLSILHEAVSLTPQEFLHQHFDVGKGTTYEVSGKELLEAVAESSWLGERIEGELTPDSEGILKLAQAVINNEEPYLCYEREYRECQRVLEITREERLSEFLGGVENLREMGPLQFRSLVIDGIRGEAIFSALSISSMEHYCDLLGQVTGQPFDPEEVTERERRALRGATALEQDLSRSTTTTLHDRILLEVGKLEDRDITDPHFMSMTLVASSSITGREVVSTLNLDTVDKYVDFLKEARKKCGTALSEGAEKEIRRKRMWGSMLSMWGSMLKSFGSKRTTGDTAERKLKQQFQTTLPTTEPAKIINELKKAGDRYTQACHGANPDEHEMTGRLLEIALHTARARLFDQTPSGDRSPHIRPTLEKISRLYDAEPYNASALHPEVIEAMHALEEQAGVRLQVGVEGLPGALVETHVIKPETGELEIHVKWPADEGSDPEVSRIPLRIKNSEKLGTLTIGTVPAEVASRGGDGIEAIQKAIASQVEALASVYEPGCCHVIPEDEFSIGLCTTLEAQGTFVLRSAIAPEGGGSGNYWSLESLSESVLHPDLAVPSLYGARETRDLIRLARKAQDGLGQSFRDAHVALQTLGELEGAESTVRDFLDNWLTHEFELPRYRDVDINRVAAHVESIGKLTAGDSLRENMLGIVSSLICTDRKRTESSPHRRMGDFEEAWASGVDTLPEKGASLPPELKEARETLLIAAMGEYGGKLFENGKFIGPPGAHEKVGRILGELERLKGRLAEAHAEPAGPSAPAAPAGGPARPPEDEIKERKSKSRPPWFSPDGSLQLFIGGPDYGSKQVLHWDPRCRTLEGATESPEEVSAAELLEREGGSGGIYGKFQCCRGCDTPVPKFFDRHMAGTRSDAEQRRWWSDEV